MTVVLNSFKDETDAGIKEWFRGMLQKSKCAVCGDLVLDHKPFIWWCADINLVLCVDCAEHTLNGLNRDLAELKGDPAAKGKTGEKYNPILLKKEVERLQAKITLHLQSIVELQNMLGRPN